MLPQIFVIQVIKNARPIASHTTYAPYPVYSPAQSGSNYHQMQNNGCHWDPDLT